MLTGEKQAGTTHTGLHFVEDEQEIPFPGKLMLAKYELTSYWDHPGLTLDRLVLLTTGQDGFWGIGHISAFSDAFVRRH